MTSNISPQYGPRYAERNMFPMFLAWYFGARPRAIVAGYVRYARAFAESFAIFFMLKTLFSPWKTIADAYPRKGLDIEGILATFFLNLTSRAIGFTIRIATVIAGVFIQIALLVLSAAYLAAWIAYPILILLSIPLIGLFS